MAENMVVNESRNTQPRGLRKPFLRLGSHIYLGLALGLLNAAAAFPFRPLTRHPLHRRDSALSLYIDDDSSGPPSPLQRRNAAIAGDYVRWNSSSNATALETAITTFTRPNSPPIQLHAMVHMGDASYYEYWNENLSSPDSVVLYELLVDDALTINTENGRQIRPGVSIQAPPAEQKRATDLGWQCQADSIDYSSSSRRSQWYHADLTSQELHELNSNTASPGNVLTEAWTALTWGPPQLNGRRRVFSNLWLDGDPWARALRAPIWLAVPSPELFQLVLDTAVQWSTVPSSRSLRLGRLSKQPDFLLPPLYALRQWMWGQVLVTGHQIGSSSAIDTPLQQRNERALRVVDQWTTNDNTRNIALLYGCHHCADLARGLRDRGYAVTSQTYRTVWSVPAAEAASSLGSSASTLLAAAVTYAALSAVDWLTLWEMGIDNLEFVLLYLARHTALYLGLSQVLLNIQRKSEEW